MGIRISLQDDENELKSALAMVAQLCEYFKNHGILHKMGELYVMGTIS